MNQSDLIERGGFVFAAVAFLFSFFLFYSYTGKFLSCIVAAILSSALFWASYVFFRLIYFSMRR